jgi:hypothetical protein
MVQTRGLTYLFEGEVGGGSDLAWRGLRLNESIRRVGSLPRR